METNTRNRVALPITRRAWFAGVALLSGCSPRVEPAEELLPATIGSWTRQEIRESDYVTGADPLAVSGVRRVLTTTYSGPGTVHVRLYDMQSQAGGLDAIQHWRPAPDTVSFHHNQYFAAVRWEETERERLTEFVRALESHVRQR